MTENRIEKAVLNHRSGYNCSQAVACAFCDKAGVSEELIFQITEGYGFGMGCMEGVCGALSGAAAIASLKVHQMDLPAGKRRKEIYRMNTEILKRFREKNKSIICKELKGIGTGKILRECPGCVADAAELVETVVLDSK